MPRIGRQIAHDEHVVVDEIRAHFSCKGAHRYSLHIPFRREVGRDQLASVVLKNPSSADAQFADTTIRRVETYVWRHLPRARALVVLNLFALRATDVSDVADYIAEHGAGSAIGDETDAVIADGLNDSDHIILAWGGTSGIPKRCYDERICEVVEMLQPHAGRIFTVNDLPASGYPLHGLRWAYRYTLQPLAI